jgi:aryl-alcohol dehydrogenase-like predicted oxidoreductase
LELAFSWLLAHPTVASVIAGATKPQQVQANASAAGWQLTKEELAEVNRLLSKPA